MSQAIEEENEEQLGDEEVDTAEVQKYIQQLKVVIAGTYEIMTISKSGIRMFPNSNPLETLVKEEWLAE